MTRPRPKRQRTIVVMIRDRETGFVSFCSIRVERKRITLNPTPALMFAETADGDIPPFDRLQARQLRLGQLLQQRWFGSTPPPSSEYVDTSSQRS